MGAGLQALLWDVDGTLAETERDGHRVAFNQAFEACGLPWRWGVVRYGELLHIAGGRERVLHDMHTRADAPAASAAREELARLLHAKKNECYADIVSTGLIALRDGVLPLMVQCQARGVRLAIATTTSRANVQALLHHHLGASWAQRFDAIVCGEDVVHKKPDPAVYLQALQLLGIAASQAVAIEDAPAGVAAARAAGVACVVTRSAYFAQAHVGEVLAVGPGLHTRKAWQPAPRGGVSEGGLIDLADIDAWHAGSGARAALL